MYYLKSFVRHFTRVLIAPFRFLFYLPSFFVSSPLRLMRLSLPARVAAVVALCLVIILVVHLLALLFVPETMEPSVWLRDHWLAAVLLIIAIPLVTYFMLKLWLQGDMSRFPDLDAAWKAGIAALNQHGLDPRSIPVYLILGAARDQQVRALFAASGQEFDVQETPQGHSPLQWFANDRGIFLVLNEASLLSKTNRVAIQQGVEPGQPAPSASGGQGIRGTLVAGGGGGAEPAAEPHDETAGSGVGGTGNWDEGGGDQLRGTMVPGIRQTLAPGAAGAGQPRGASQPPATGRANLTRQESELQAERLRYVCRLLVRARQPLCPINGILTLFSVQVIANIMAAKEVQDAVSSDLRTLHDALQLCSPVVALVVGMEEKSGFFELVRRVGTSSRQRRFGKGFQVWSRPGEEQLDALSMHACGAFEDWVYHLFQEPGGLNKTGNRKLYNLLCEIRLRLQARIRNILVNAYSCASSADTGDEQDWLFGGCYFAATGDTEDRQAFVRDVFRRMVDLQDEVEWSHRALVTDQRYQRLAQFGMLVDGVLAVGLLALLVGWYRGMF